MTHLKLVHVAFRFHGLRAACTALVAGAALTPAVALAQPEEPATVTPPTVLTHVDATYPTSALAAGKHADVVLYVTVDTDGHVSNVEVHQSAGRDLDEAAIIAVRQWTFTPAMKAGKAVRSRISVPFHFAPPAPPPTTVLPPQSGPPVVQGGGVVGAGGGSVGVTGSSPSNLTPANPPPPVNPPPKTAEPHIEEVHVVSRPIPPSRGASDVNFRIGDLGMIPRKNASELLTFTSSILLTNEGGEGHAEQVFLRGFDAREGQDIEFTVGGVPINESGNLHGNGYADTHFIIPELVESLRVVEGPFDPRQGNYAVAGSADYHLGLDRRGITGKYTGGSFGTERLLLTWGPPGESTHTFAGVELYKTDGYGMNRDATRGTAMGQYEGKIGSRGSYRITTTAYTTHYHSAGVLRDDDFRAGRVGFYDTYDPQQGGDSSRFSLAGDVTTRVGSTTLGQQLFIIRRGMRLRESFTGFLLDVQTPIQAPHEQRGDLLDLNVDETTYGARGYARIEGTAFDLKQRLEVGYYARVDDVTGSQQRIEAGNAHPYRTETNLTSLLTDIGLYADADVKPVKWLSLRGGARADVFTYNVNDLCAVEDVSHPTASNPTGASCLAQEDLGQHREPNQRSSTASMAVMPRGSILFGPFEGFVLSLSYGQGVRSVDPIYITQDTRTPFASVTAYDAGVTYAKTLGNMTVVARSIGFQTHVDKTLIFSQNAGRNVLGGGTTRTGWTGSVRLTGPWFDQAANMTVVRSEFDDTHLLVPYIPDVVFRSDTAVHATMPFSIAKEPVRGALSTGITYVGPRALPYGERSQNIFTVDTSATLAWSSYEVGLIFTNLFDRRYRLGEYNYASDFHTQSEPTLSPMRHFTAGAPRGVFATLSATFGGP